MKLSALSWAGGKSSGSFKGTGKWIASLLPADRDVCYVEPFAGMLGVLLQRPKSKSEIVNDLDGRVTNWWRVVRESPNRLGRLMINTPRSRIEYDRCVNLMTDKEADDVTRAWAFTVAVTQSYGSKVTSGFGVSFTGNERNGNCYYDRVKALHRRIQDVQIECQDACHFIERIAHRTHILAYLDPPYKDVSDDLYGATVDRDRLFDILKEVKGRFAISGYGTEWEKLGWVRSERESCSTLPTTTDPVYRTEVLWTNYQPNKSQITMFD